MGLSGPEKKMVKDYAYQLLFPEGPIDIPRPIPVRTHKAFHTGQLILDTNADSFSVEVSPDPFSFARITSKVPNGTEVSRLFLQNNADISDLAPGDGTNGGTTGSNTTFSYQVPMQLSRGWARPAIRSVLANAPSRPVVAIDGAFAFDRCAGYENVMLNGGVTEWFVSQSSLSTIKVDVLIGRVQADGQLTIDAVTTGHNVPPNTPVQINLNTGIILADTTVSGARLFFGLRLTDVSAGPVFQWNKLTFGPNFLDLETVTDGYLINNYTIGQALYSTEPDKAEQLDSLYRQCQLWSPVACSTIVNVTQVLRERGGNFLSAYLPSNTAGAVPPDPDAAWPVIKAYGRSYPVATTTFAVGAQATWVGSRIQDYEFRRPFVNPFWLNFEKTSMPRTLILAQRALSDSPATARYYIDFRVAFSVQTLDPKIEMKMGVACPNFCLLFLSLVAANEGLVGENPDHIRRLMEIAKSVATDPRVVSLLKMGLSKGLPLLMAALA